MSLIHFLFEWLGELVSKVLGVKRSFVPLKVSFYFFAEVVQKSRTKKRKKKKDRDRDKGRGREKDSGRDSGRERNRDREFERNR